MLEGNEFNIAQLSLRAANQSILEHRSDLRPPLDQDRSLINWKGYLELALKSTLLNASVARVGGTLPK